MKLGRRGPAGGAGAGYRLRLSVVEDGLALFEAALARLGGALAVDAEAEGGRVPLAVYLPSAPDAAEVHGLLAAAAAAAGTPAPEFRIEPVALRDWVAESRSALPAVRAGRLRVVGSHLPAPPPPAIVVRIDAGQAFGTGHHESTRGCLLMLDWLARCRRPARLLDLGCGSGILAIAMAKLWRRPVLACDVDPVAVETARSNARANGVGARVRVARADGPRRANVRGGGPYDLIAANILAGPLCAMAGDIAAALAPGGLALLSGLLRGQEAAVLARYRAWGLCLTKRRVLGEWVTLLLAARAHENGPRRGAGRFEGG